MRLHTLSLLLILLVAPITVSAQVAAEVGVRINYSTSYDPSPDVRRDGGQATAGAYVAASYGNEWQARARVSFLPKSTLLSIFNSDADTGRLPTAELEIEAGLRYTFPTDRTVRPFAEAGVKRLQQFFEATRAPLPLPTPLPPIAPAAHEENEEYEDEYGDDAPNSALNPYLKVGVLIGDRHEASFSRIFTDQIGKTELTGYGVSYAYTRPVGGRLAVKIGVDADDVQYRDTAPGGYVARYFKHDNRINFTVGLIYR